MRTIHMLMIACLLGALNPQSRASDITYPEVLKVGGTASWGKDSSMAKYGDGTPFMEWPDTRSNDPASLHGVLMWKVDSGVLVLECTFGMLKIVKMTYVVRDQQEQIVASFPVKEFNYATGEMTIITSNHGLESTGAPPAAGTPETHP